MSEHDDVQRGQEAERLLANPLLAEAFAAFEQRILDALRSADRDDRERQKLCDLLVAATAVRKHLERLVKDGKLAAHEIALIERRSLMSRVLQRV